jgi:hypothetical protein
MNAINYLSNFNVKDKWNTDVGLVLCVRRTELWVKFAMSLLYLPDSGSHSVKKLMFSDKATCLVFRKMREIWVTTSCVVVNTKEVIHQWMSDVDCTVTGFILFSLLRRWSSALLNATALYILRNSSGRSCLKTRIAAAVQTWWGDVAMGVEALNIVQIYCLMRTE